MNPYQYLNSNNGQLTDSISSPKLDAYLHSLMNGVTINPYNQSTDEYGNPTSDYEVNGIGQATKVGDNKYSIGIDDPSSRGLFDVNVEVDPTTGKLSNLGTTYSSRGNNTQWYAPLAMAAMFAAPALAPELFGAVSGAETGTALAGDAFLPDALANGVAGGEAVGNALGTEGLASGSAVGGGEGAVGGAVGGSGASLTSGTAYAPGATTNYLSPFYGTAQASPTSLGLVSGGGGSSIGEGSIIGSGAGLGQTVPANVLNVANSLNLPKPKTPQQNMANALRLPTNANTNVPLYRAENPFYYSPQQQLANMLKV